jgi:hypothetical protein
LIGKVVRIKVGGRLVIVDRKGKVDLGLKIGAIVILQRNQGEGGIGLQVYHQGLQVIQRRAEVEEGQNIARLKAKKIRRVKKRNPVRNLRRRQNQRKNAILKVAGVKVSHIREAGPRPCPKISNQNSKNHNY